MTYPIKRTGFCGKSRDFRSSSDRRLPSLPTETILTGQKRIPLDSFRKNCYVPSIGANNTKPMLGATSSINNYPNVFGVQSGQSMEQLAKTLTASAQQKIPTDSVSISSAANMLQQFLNSEMQGGEQDGMGDLDLVGLAQLKQRGDMLASMLQLKMKNFESHLMANMKGAGLQAQDMNLKNGDDGLMLMGEMPDKEMFQSALGGLQGEFTDIARLAEVLNMLQQMGPDNIAAGLSSAAQYAQQSQADRSSVKRPETDFILHVMQSGTSFSFE